LALTIRRSQSVEMTNDTTRLISRNGRSDSWSLVSSNDTNESNDTCHSVW